MVVILDQDALGFILEPDHGDDNLFQFGFYLTEVDFSTATTNEERIELALHSLMIQHQAGGDRHYEYPARELAITYSYLALQPRDPQSCFDQMRAVVKSVESYQPHNADQYGCAVDAYAEAIWIYQAMLAKRKDHREVYKRAQACQKKIKRADELFNVHHLSPVIWLAAGHHAGQLGHTTVAQKCLRKSFGLLSDQMTPISVAGARHAQNILKTLAPELYSPLESDLSKAMATGCHWLLHYEQTQMTSRRLLYLRRMVAGLATIAHALIYQFTPNRMVGHLPGNCDRALAHGLCKTLLAKAQSSHGYSVSYDVLNAVRSPDDIKKLGTPILQEEQPQREDSPIPIMIRLLMEQMAWLGAFGPRDPFEEEGYRTCRVVMVDMLIAEAITLVYERGSTPLQSLTRPSSSEMLVAMALEEGSAREYAISLLPVTEKYLRVYGYKLSVDGFLAKFAGMDKNQVRIKDTFALVAKVLEGEQ